MTGDVHAKLRPADPVRYEIGGGRPQDWLKQGRETRAVLAGLMRFVRTTADLRAEG